jgi:uncharacterized membrane protein YidH (DUF202 family)
MIRDYTDHSANERTFLAWVRSGIAVIAFGFVIEKFDLFVRTLRVRTLLHTHTDRNLKSYRSIGPLRGAHTHCRRNSPRHHRGSAVCSY